MVNFTVEDRDGSRQTLEVPEDMGLNLMETLKAFEYNILATCGGIALCATCHVKVLEGGENLPELGEAEGQMLDIDDDGNFIMTPIDEVKLNLGRTGLSLRTDKDGNLITIRK